MQIRYCFYEEADALQLADCFETIPSRSGDSRVCLFKQFKTICTFGAKALKEREWERNSYFNGSAHIRT